MKISKKGFTLAELGIVFIIIGVLASMSIHTGHGRRRYPADQPECFKNQRILNGAVEMYNMDYSVMIDTVLPGRDFEDFEEMLIDKKYLNEYLPLASPNCAYGLINITGEGYVFCKNHGTYTSKDRENPTFPEYDKKLEIPFSPKYINRINDTKRRINREQLSKNIEEFLSSPPFFIGIGVLFVFVSIIAYSNQKLKKKH